MLAIDPTKKLSFQRLINNGDLVIVYERHDIMKAIKVCEGSELQNRFGVFKHSDWIGKPFGSKVLSNKGGFVYLLAPTPELWTLVLSHRTQILYIADISFVITYLEIVPGCLVLESGTGSGSLSTSLARAIAPNGHVYTFDFHEQRAASAREDFEKTGLSSLVTVRVRDIQGEGFPDEFCGMVDAVFLDLPQPWLAIPSAGKMLKPDGVLCSFSPCIEQVQRSCETLLTNFTDIRTFEVLLRTYEVREERLECGGIDYVSSPGSFPRKRRQCSSRSSNGTDKSSSTTVMARPSVKQEGHTGYLTFVKSQMSPIGEAGMNSNSGEGKVVCVTGASGYIASWLVKLLLERGYTVRGTVRDLNDPKKTEHLRALPGANERLKLFEANLEEEGTFDSVIDGCQGVFHTASPCFFTATDPQAQLIDPAVKGTLNVLGSCAKSPSVKRVVVTSSFAAVAYNGTPRTPEVIIDETWFSDPDICRETKSWYQLSKTLAEAAAWKFAKENGLDIIIMNPAAVIGPLVQPTLNSTSASILNLINGSETFPNMTFGWVHVRDVANAHILGFEIPSASGRYCLVERVLHISDITKILNDLFPCLPRTQKCADDKPFVPTYQVSTEKAKGLGIDFIPLELGLKEMVQSLKEKNFINF